ncbi:50S ribosomal protein L25 [Fuchsiella alkaliacetigena]|uniref:50S ribosomal protein L25 n=1 Tax=Fuchsiella alkaliacetigena TaxID=957042 RepID=UPI00200A18AD|nr:50S ribosomal protein L25 [Fuchsiella alkaliacetigena]MCK8824915.1 50S ribosomal protein L25 [Fuchsiella alkaliacetigena]
MEQLELEVELRDETGRNQARRLREEGLVPGVIYGQDREPATLKLDANDLAEVTGGNKIINLKLEDDVEAVMIKDLQKDAITGEFLHVDFHQINLDETVVVEVSVDLVGTSAGEREGGVRQQLLREVKVECLPTEIPASIEIDISELEVGESLHVAELETADEVEIITSGDEVLVTVVAPTELDLEEPEEDEEDLLEEPEVIGEEPDEELEEGEEVPGEESYEE